MLMNTITAKEGGKFVEKPRPEWAEDPKLYLTKEKAEEFNKARLGTHPRMEFVGENLNADVVLPGDTDVIFHFFLRRAQPDFDTFLGEIVESHFGSTDNFAVAFTPEVDSWGLKAQGLRSLPLYSVKSHIEDFLRLVDASLGLLHASTATSGVRSRKV